MFLYIYCIYSQTRNNSRGHLPDSQASRKEATCLPSVQTLVEMTVRDAGLFKDSALGTQNTSALTYNPRIIFVHHSLDGHVLLVLSTIKMQTFISTSCFNEQDDSFNNLYQDVGSIFLFIYVDIVQNYGSKRRKLNCLLDLYCNLGRIKRGLLFIKIRPRQLHG